MGDVVSYPTSFLAWWPDEGETFEDAIAIEMPVGWLRSTHAYRYAAEQAGEYDYDNRDGWERSDYVQTVAVVAVDAHDQPLGPAQQFRVACEVVPEFHAQRMTLERGSS